MPGNTTASRRDLLTGGLALGLGAGGALLPSSSVEAAAGVRLPDFADPSVNLREVVRMQGSLREEDVPWWFTGVIFAVTGEGETPRPLVRFEGLEIYWFQHVPGGYVLGGNTVTFFRDYDTQQFLYEFANPWTGRRDAVRPAVQGGNLGFSYSTDGIWPVRLDGSSFGEPRRQPLRLQWHSMRDYVWLQHQTVYPPGMPPMHGQRQSMFVPARQFVDRRVDALPSVFSSTVFMGWLKWMDMKDRPGHVIWHASGVKLRSVDELPSEYLQRAQKEYPERLTARPGKIARPA